MRKEHRTQVAVIALSLGCVTLLTVAIYAGLLWMKGNAPPTEAPMTGEFCDRSMAIGNTIIHAIDAYHTDTGTYPTKLNDLVPQYLAEITNPVAGTREWYYYVHETNNGYTLKFASNEFGPQYPCMYWRSDTGEWHADF